MTHAPTRRRRFIAGVLAGAMALAVTPILGFTGTAGAAVEPTGEGSVCEDAPETDPFDDVADDDTAVDEIRCMVNTDPRITEGTSASTYSPLAPVSRRQMALFLQRVGDLAEAQEIDDNIQALPEGDGETPFEDLDDESDAVFDAIDRLHEAEVANGVTDTEFRPGADVSRRQMAKFLVDLQEYLSEGITPDDPDDHFDDDEGDSGEDELNILAEQGIFEGDADGDVNPGDDITRRQMALVLTRTLQVLFENGDITRLFADPGAPRIREVAAIEDPGPLGEDSVTPQDVHRFIFSNPMDEALAEDSAYTVEDEDENDVDITCGGNSTCEFNQSTVSIGGTEHPALTVLTVTIDQPLPALPPVGYPATITEVTEEWVDEDGIPLDLDGSPDTEIEVDEDAPETEQIRPRPRSAEQTDDTPDAVSITFSEPVNSTETPGEFTVLPDDGECGDEPVNNGTADEIASDDGDEVLVIIFNSNVAPGEYDLCVGSDAVEDLDGNPNLDQTVPVTFNA